MKKYNGLKIYSDTTMWTGDIKITIDYDKYKADSVWDGLKGYFTNTKYKRTCSRKLPAAMACGKSVSNF